jgi:hypothetical protein
MKINSSVFFEYVNSDRPYVTPSSTKEWMKLPTTSIPLNGLITTQATLGVVPLVRSVLGYPSTGCVDQVPHVVYYGGRLWISDGHHRIAARMLRNKKVMNVRLFDGDMAERLKAVIC